MARHVVRKRRDFEAAAEAAVGRRLTSADVGAGAAVFGFDPAGRLATSAASSATTRYQYAGAQLVAEYDGSGALARRHVPGLGLDGVVASYDGAGTTNRSWLLADERGSVVGLAGSTGAVTSINRYDEYGVPASGNAGRFQYTGQQWLAEAESYHYRARSYLQGAGRFGQTDPVGYGAGTNLYAYVGGDPVNLVDPLGLQDTLPGVISWGSPPGRPPLSGALSTSFLTLVGGELRVSQRMLLEPDGGTDGIQGVDRGRIPQCLAAFVQRQTGIDMSTVYIVTRPQIFNPNSITLNDTVVLVPDAYNNIFSYLGHFFHEMQHVVQYAEGRLTYTEAIREYGQEGYEDAWFEVEARQRSREMLAAYRNEKPCG